MNFQEKVFPEAYVASAVDGTVPSADEVDAIWLQLTARHGIEFGRKGEWIKGIPRGVATTDENQQGSIDVVSFNNVRNALLNALEAYITVFSVFSALRLFGSWLGIRKSLSQDAPR
jgi:hypothetical protein